MTTSTSTETATESPATSASDYASLPVECRRMPPTVAPKPASSERARTPSNK
jgi:hypothetical protein